MTTSIGRACDPFHLSIQSVARSSEHPTRASSGPVLIVVTHHRVGMKIGVEVRDEDYRAHLATTGRTGG